MMMMFLGNGGDSNGERAEQEKGTIHRGSISGVSHAAISLPSFTPARGPASSSQTMRVTIVVGSLRAGGQERVAANMANHWAAKGWRPSIVTIYQRGREIAFDLHPNVTVHDVGWFRAPREHELDAETMSAVARAMNLSRDSEETLLADVVLVGLLRRTIIETAADAVVSLGDSTNIRMLLATDGLPMRRIVSEHCDPRFCTIGDWEVLRRRFYPRADAVVTLTADAAGLIGRYGTRCTVVPSFVVASPVQRSGTTHHRVITVTRLDPAKRIGMLIEAFARVALQHPRWRLEIWGDGPERARVDAHIERLSMRDRITLHGATRDVSAALARGDIFAMTSATEGFPNALCEAMAAGLPAVVVDCGAGVRDIVRDGVDGLLVRSHAIRDFASALERLMSNDDERRALAARAPEIVERFSAARVMGQWEELLGWN
ncbi:MAG: glycosyltransferase [Acidobacteria bacterium]|nr:glycosyltransferase [Acidobacteriota bacterium]